jgi:hypothetical protein
MSMIGGEGRSAALGSWVHHGPRLDAGDHPSVTENFGKKGLHFCALFLTMTTA